MKWDINSAPGFEICEVREKKVSIWEWHTQGGEGHLQRWERRCREVANHRIFLASGGGKICLMRKGHEGISRGNGNVL